MALRKVFKVFKNKTSVVVFIQISTHVHAVLCCWLSKTYIRSLTEHD